MKRYYLGIDQGTTGVTAILFNTEWQQVSRGYRELRQILPQDGWVEHDALEIWEAVCTAVRDALRAADATPQEILCGVASAARKALRMPHHKRSFVSG